jgi:hypothetical protein
VNVKPELFAKLTGAYQKRQQQQDPDHENLEEVTNERFRNRLTRQRKHCEREHD